jgi:cobalt/nickel transport system permease protein
MHMADALLSPAVGGTMWAATAATTVYCANKVRRELDPAKVPLMGVLGAFVFAAQMLNFSIPGTGSSGHLGGGLLLAILLGPEAAFLVIASVLSVQALFFADGGLLALGANIFNLGFFPAFVAYPLIYRPIAGDQRTPWRVGVGALVAAIVGLQLGALGVVMETVLSGVSALPFVTFATIMLPIHLAIGVVEGLVTAAVVLFVQRTQPELLAGAAPADSEAAPGRRRIIGPVLVTLAILALLAGATFSWFASTDPDGLEWTIAKVTGSEGEPTGVAEAVRAQIAAIQERTSLLPGYGFKSAGETTEAAWGRPNAGTSVSGVVGAGIVLALVGAIGGVLVWRRRRADGDGDGSSHGTA